MAEFISVPLKKPTDVDIVKPLKNVIDSTYSTSDKPEDYTEQINELSKLRSTAVWRVFEKYESSLEVIYSYYDQLVALEAKIPPTEVQIPFKWKDAFNKGSFFGGRISLTISSLAYERVCVLFNIAALQSAVASAQSMENDDGLKLAAKLFQQSAGILNNLKNTVIGAIHQDPTPDLHPDTLAALSSLMLAQAQEVFVHKAVYGNMKDAVIAKLSSQCEELYAECMRVFQKESVRQIWDKDWIPIIAGKQAIFHGIAQFRQSLVCRANKAVGEEITRLNSAIELFKVGQQRWKPSACVDHLNKAQRNLSEAQKDNDFIYHERIPDAKNLEPIPRAAVAKPLPMPQKLSASFKDLFENLIPMAVHQSLASYEVRKNELVTIEINKLRESTQLLNSVLASLNLPAALEDTCGEALPPSLAEKAEHICSLGGVQKLESMIRELPELLQRNKDIIDEADRMLQEEKASDDQLKEQFKERWTRTPSDKLTETFRVNTSKYRELVNNAIQADKTVRDKFEAHKRGIELLSEGPNVMQASIPKAVNGDSSAHESSAASNLRHLMEQVETMKAERDSIECELKSATSDMKEQFLSALTNDGTINEQALSIEILGRVFGPLQKQVKDSLAKQESLLAEIQLQNTAFCNERSGVGGAAAKRDAVLKELAAAHDAYVELLSNLQEGTKFYNDLTQMLLTFQNKISDYVFARKTEKEELMKDLTQSISRDGKKEPPPRPPPPNVSVPSSSSTSTAPSGLPPYPSYPQGMPIPYGAPTSAPYPTQYIPPPLPTGYNPYATLPYPTQLQQPYPGYQPYANYPPTYPQYPPYAGNQQPR
ncbi:programmed cell death 6-interacting protein-like protein AliX isoform X2 [Lycorma delicatula]|uniref:programmed cell death 6-interacting protein-like protein AliX isoform X2 n=1 Tax=Lycorma delicatula TaxID=130591 RepID=UPI003F513DFD